MVGCLTTLLMRYVPLERDINIVINGPSWVEGANPEHPFTAMLISHSRNTCLIEQLFNFLSTDVIYGWSPVAPARLHHVHVLAAHVLQQLHARLLVGELGESAR